MIDEEATYRLFGYRSTDWKKNSHKKIVVICDNPDCKGDKVRIINKHQYSPLCRFCAMRKRFEDPKEHEKSSIAQLKRFEDPKECEKISIGGLKRFEDPKEREKLSVAKLKWNNDNPEQAKINATKCGIASVKAQDGRPSSIEFKMRKILTDNNYKFSTNVSVLSFCVPDIVFREEKVIIQCDGDYWHKYPDGLEKDYNQDKILKSNGWQVIRFWEHEINNDIEKCLEEFEWKTFRRFG